MQRYKSHFRETLYLSLPVSIGQFGHIMLNVTDSLMVGRVGPVPLAASSLVLGLLMLVIVFGLGLGLAVSSLTAITHGKGKQEECGTILKHGLLLNVACSVILSLAIYFLSELIFFMDQPPAVAELAVSYAKIIGMSIIPYMVFLTYRHFIEGLSVMKPAMYVTVGALFMNVFANWILIYGNLGFPAMGLDGAGYATVITRFFMAVILVGYVSRAQNLKKFNPGFKSYNINRQVIRDLVRLGIPSGFQYFFEVGAFTVSAIMIGWMGSNELAAHQIALSLASISFMIVLGISSASTVRVGTAYGRNDPVNLRRAGFTGLSLATLVMAGFGVVFLIFRHELPQLFVDDESVLNIAASLLIVAALYQISDGVQAVGLGILRSIRDVKIPTFVTLLAYWVIGLTVGYLLGFKCGFGVVGIWIGLMTGLSIAGGYFVFRFNRQTGKILLRSEIT